MNDKIKPQHLARKAILYIRQSSAYQVTHNLESQKLQYAMQERLHRLGWTEIEVVDEDLGRSASGAVARAGFERMVAEVCLGKVGAVAAREVSRFARNSREWQQLVEVCRVVDTVLIDQEAVYLPRQGNDRLLLGLKGSLNEYELDLLRQRSLEARQAKAKRGELLVAAPVGYLKTDEHRLEKDPDQRVQQAVLMVFRKVIELSSVRQALLWFLEHGLQLPAQAPDGAICWKRPTYGAIYRMLTNPTYGGAYAYGKSQAITHYADGEQRHGQRRKPRSEWSVLIPNAHEGYVGWDQFEQIRQTIAANLRMEEQTGAAQHGPALLTGLLRCRRCGRKLTVRYTGKQHDALRYACCRGWLDNGEPRCIAFGGTVVDEALSREVLRVVQPAAIAAAVLASEDQARKCDEVLEALQRDLEAAHYAARRAQKQFDAADPDNRLVVGELERRWNLALERVSEIELRITQHGCSQDAAPTEKLEDCDVLAAELESVWHHPEADVRLKKRIVRTLIEEIVVDVDSQASEVVLIIHWKGGIHTELRLPRRRRGQNASHTSQEVVAAVKALASICPDPVIAGILNRNALKTGRGNRWTQERVTALRSHHKIACYSADRCKEEGWMNLTQAARFLGVSPKTLRLTAQRGDIEAAHPLPDGPWIFRREALQTPAAACLVDRTRSGPPTIPTAQKNLFDLSTT